MKRIVIVGTGMAGYMLAQSIRQVSGEVSITLVAERDGRFYPKPMLSTALYHHKSPQDMVTASAAEMAKQYKLEVKTETKVTKIEVVEKKVFCENGEVIGYDNLVLATGSSARHLREDKERCCYSINSIEDYERLLLALQDKKRVLIIGSGLVGVEFAHDLLQAGYEVSLFSQEVMPLSGLVPEEIGGVCKQHLLSLGLNWLQDDSIAEITDKSGKVEVGFAKQRRETFDVVISAIGIRAETDLGRSIGLVVDQGIVTDEYGQTSQEGVFAIGDCAQIYGLNLTYVAPIRQQAKAIGQSLLGKREAIAYPAMPVVVKMPTLPLTLVPVRAVDIRGEWQIEVMDKDDISAGFYDQKGNLKGFALVGRATQQRSEWLKKMPASIVA